MREIKYPSKQRFKYTDDDLIAAAKLWKTRGEWKRNDSKRYQAAILRGLLERCCAHMQRAANPYAGDYIIYAYEFTDKHAYVGLTFLPGQRKATHRLRGPVAEHTLVCPEFSYKVLQSGLTSPEAAAEAEQRHVDRYKSDGWTMLNINKAGGIGCLRRRWTKEAVLEEAKKYSTRQAWIDGSQASYRTAMREGWRDEAAAHMPKHDATHLFGRTVSAESREKMRLAKLGKTHSDAHRQKQSESVKASWSDRQSSSVGTGSVAK